MKYSFGIDVGGTNIKIGLFEVDPFRLVDKREVSTPKYNHTTSIFEVTKKNMTDLLDLHHITYNDVHGVGFAIPCPVKNGYVVKCPNLKWESLDVISSMRDLLEPHIKVVVSNDANIAAYGENYSLEVPLQNAIFYTLGTGVGGGIIIDGKIVEGRTGAGGEIGHMQIFEQKPF